MKKQCAAEPRAVGRPREIDSGRRVMLYLDPDTLEKAAAIGSGSVSKGVRLAIAAASVKKPKV